VSIEAESTVPADDQASELASFYVRIGGRATFENLVSHFYALVVADPILSPMYPHSDMHGAANRLLMFLEQYWGGPKTYSEQRGHPRLRMRHAGFPINQAAHDAWLACMRSAMDEIEGEPELKAELWSYFEFAASSLVNLEN
jgi:hemoglobin